MEQVFWSRFLYCQCLQSMLSRVNLWSSLLLLPLFCLFPRGPLSTQCPVFPVGTDPVGSSPVGVNHTGSDPVGSISNVSGGLPICFWGFLGLEFSLLLPLVCSYVLSLPYDFT